ncbi:glycosyltransferase, partial [Clostridioides difficile]|nr:glycosyltransferase [Clostridioides difficile]
MDSYISIIIPAYNEESRIKYTLESILDIKQINEIIVVDDG